MQAVTSATGRPGAPMKGTDTMTDGEIDALNERRLDDAGEAMGTQVVPGVTQRSA